MLLFEFTKDTEELDNLLLKCCQQVLHKHENDPHYWGMVGACVLDDDGNTVFGVNHLVKDKLRDHAEVVAIKKYISKYGSDDLQKCTIITTLSPCSSDIDQPDGRNCTSYIDQYGIKKVYCGYIDPNECDTSVYKNKKWELTSTKNGKLEELCKKMADTFLPK